jgi:epsin
VTGIEESSGSDLSPRRPRDRPHRAQRSDEEDAEYRLAIEASKYQEEEDRKKRESRLGVQPDDDDLAKAIKLSKEEEELRRRELEDQNAASLFDDAPVQTMQPQYTSFNQGYQQQSAVDWSGNPIDPNAMQQQQTGFLQPNYTNAGFQSQPTGYQNGFGQQNTGFDPYGQQQQQQQQYQQFQPQPTGFQPQPTGFNPYLQQQQQQPEPVAQAGTNNPWATNHQTAQVQKPMPTGSNNPFATSFSRPQTSTSTQPTLATLQEQKTLSQFNNSPSFNPSTSFSQPQQASAAPQKELNPHEARLNALLASGDGMDTFGNTGNLRIPAQHTAPGTFVNSAAHGLGRINEQATGTNPFLQSQFTGMPQTSYGGNTGFGGHQVPAATGPAGMGNNPFGQRQQQHGGGGDLIQF